MENPFIEKRVNSFRFVACAFLVTVATIWGVVSGGVLLGMGLMALPALFLWLFKVFGNPRLGLITLLVVNYFVMGVSRYVPGPLGLAIDSILVTTYIALIFNRISFRPAARELTLLAGLWYMYAIFQLFNPEVISREAWFYAMRGFSLYFLMVVPLCFILFNRRDDLRLFFTLWSVFTLLAVLKAFVQFFGYLDYAELRWLAQGGAKTHLVAGKLRIFSFFTDAGQFGASMGMSGVVFLIASFGLKSRIKWYYLFVSAIAFIGMFLSGTRGAIAVPAAGMLMYVLVSGRWRSIMATLVVMVSVFVFFKYTHIGDSNYQIARMRTAFRGNDASFEVRLQNQAKLSDYLASRPFGGGIGSAGNWGMRFTPDTFLAQTPTDSWYVAIWAEQGIVGLLLYLSILLYILIAGARHVIQIRGDTELEYRLKALLCGIAGVAVASYTNGVIGQMPTGVIVYMSMAFIFMGDRLK